MSYLEEQTPQEENLSRGVGISIGLHALIIMIFTVRAIFFTPEKIDFSQAIKVDMVGLPDKVQTLPPPELKQEPKAAAPEEKPAEPVAKEEPPAPAPPPKLPPKPKDEAINIDKVKSQQKSALDKLKAMAALEKIKEDVAHEKKKAAAAPVRGNILSPGSSLTGLNKLQHDTYAADLNTHIKERWQLPEWLAKRDYKAQARVFIDSRGNILGRKIVISSGNPSYDEAVLETIDRAAPFPAPPEKFLAIISADGILIGFPE